MEACLETFAVLCLAVAGGLSGRYFSRRPSPWWLLGWVLPFVLIAGVALARWRPEFSLEPPFSWWVAGRGRFATLCFAGPFALTTPLSRLPHRTTRFWIYVLQGLLVGFAITPFWAPALVESELRGLKTRFAEGVCLQSKGYTCGPAAAVTALRRLGLAAEEGELAILTHTTPIGGTPTDSLILALRDRYGDLGLTAEIVVFKDLSELDALLGDEANPGGPEVTLPDERFGMQVIVVVKHSFLVDHLVALLESEDDGFVLGDPLAGKRRVTRREFETQWRRSAIVLRRG